MAITTTPNLELTKDSADEFYDVTRVNANMDKIDAAVAAKANKSELPNIKKNPSDTTGDIIDTHLTVGTRTGDCGENSVTIGTGHTATGARAACSGREHTITSYDSACISGYKNQCTSFYAGCLGGSENTAAEICTVCAGGFKNIADGQYTACVGGRNNQSTGIDSTCIGGHGSNCSGEGSVCIGGRDNQAAGNDSACLGGSQNETTGEYGICLAGNNNSAGEYQVKIGHYAKDGESHTDEGGVRSGDAIIIGNGSINTASQEVTRSNAFRVSYAGRVYGTGAYSSSGADYAEFFEWQDGNPGGEDRRGIFVTLDGEKIRPCNAGEYILGVVSSNPSVCGDSASENWHSMYETNIFGDIIYDNGEPKISPQYDPSKTYVPREKRPEWAAVGMLGKLVVTDDGTCEPNGCCAPSQNGIATAAETGYRVLSRIDSTHIKILVR